LLNRRFVVTLEIDRYIDPPILSADIWPIYRYRFQKRVLGRSLRHTVTTVRTTLSNFTRQSL